MTRTSIESSARPAVAARVLAGGGRPLLDVIVFGVDGGKDGGSWALPLGVAVVLVDEGAEGGHGFEAIALGGGAAGLASKSSSSAKTQKAYSLVPSSPPSFPPPSLPATTGAVPLFWCCFHDSNFNWIVCPSVNASDPTRL